MFTYLIVLRIILIYEILYNKVIQWATYHKDDPPPPEDDENKEKRTDDISFSSNPKVQLEHSVI